MKAQIKTQTTDAYSVLYPLTADVFAYNFKLKK